MRGIARPIVVLTDGSIHPEAVDRLSRHCVVRVLQDYPPESVLLEACVDAQAILARLGVVTGDVIEAAGGLRIIARHGAGSDGVDIGAATARGVVVTTTGSANAGAVAEYTFALLLALLRNVTAADHGMREGRWDRVPLVGQSLEGRTLGIIGLGTVGARVRSVAEAFGMRVLVAASPRHTGTPLDLLLREADIVSLHGRHMPGDGRVLDAVAIAAMKPGAVLVNTARGEMVDEVALIGALRTGRLAGAALDTYALEPLARDSPLRAVPNVLLSPHVAGQTEAAIRRVGLMAVDAILDELAGRRPRFVVNPEAYDNRGGRGVA